MASVSFTYGGDYKSSDLVNLFRNGVNLYSGPNDFHVLGVDSNGYYYINDSSVRNGIGFIFTDGMRLNNDPLIPGQFFAVAGSDHYAINADFSDNIPSVDLSGGKFGDVLRGGFTSDAINGGEGNDLIEGGAGADTLIGGSGNDTATYEHSTSGVYARLDSGSGLDGDAMGDTLIGFENLTGTAFDDALVGDESDNVLRGNGGADDISGHGGNDRIVISATPASVDGNAGKDFLFVTGGGAVSLDNFSFSGFEYVYVRNGTTLDMSLVENGSKIGSQSTIGHSVEIIGTSGADIIRAGSGNDTIEGSAGKDKLFAGSGDDTFRFEAGFGRDNVYNFTVGVDRLDVSALVDDFTQVTIRELNGGANTLITFEGAGAGNKIILHDVAALSLGADDFGLLAN